PTTEGVRQATLRKVMEQALRFLDSGKIKELLPEELSRGMISLPDAIRLLHNPPPNVALIELEKGHHPAQKRLILEELLAHHLSMLAISAGNERLYAEPLATSGQLKSQLLAQLPFSPTNAQNRVVSEIEADLAKDV
ncbi:ATP-dependent DNA helicase RecG, partial [Providencia manganoxydans]